ncbi:MAG: bifunctional diaminohydroxyphosphoribosylaminopyrimidine deaminase/5-amino-6-(5-phosphoribosylamino)uracil reductase RibD [Eubacterium sp.]
MTDEHYMKQALILAQKGCGFVAPNPMVGAVIVKNDQIIGQGFHEGYGLPHAERNALADCTESEEGATLYVTLEPCCHFGKTPPCTDAIINSGISKVVIGSSDPNPMVGGMGVKQLRNKGIMVVEGVLKEECDLLNSIFFHYIKTGLPFVVMKYAMTMDGKIATHTGESKWITGEVSRQRVQEDRHRYTAIMVGVGTVISDDPLLTCRLEGGKNPIRVICDTQLRTPLSAQVVRTTQEAPTILATCCDDKKKHQAYTQSGCYVMVLPEMAGHLDLKALMIQLGHEKIDSILLEGGATLNASALNTGIVNKVQAYIAPKIFGGKQALSPIGGGGVDHPKGAYFLKNTVITPYGDDFLLESEVISHVYRNH